MEKKVLDAMKKAGKPVRPGDIAKVDRRGQQGSLQGRGGPQKGRKDQIPQALLL
jgi:hypothetical protein